MDGLLGVAGMMTLLVIMDHSRKFPAFSTSKLFMDLKKVQHTIQDTIRYELYGHFSLSGTSLYIYIYRLIILKPIEIELFNIFQLS